ncbi:hypothetical protein [Methylobacterium sp. C1]|nr:hypothetical protein [Methylobacterium sp. C1]
MTALLTAPLVASVAVGLAALLWCRGFVPLVGTAIGCGLVWVLV